MKRICEFNIQDEDGEPFINVYHTTMGEFVISIKDEKGRETHRIGMDEAEAGCVAFALCRLIEGHGEGKWDFGCKREPTANVGTHENHVGTHEK